MPLEQSSNYYDYAVVGAGMIGSATARHISLQLAATSTLALIGPNEPTTAWAHHNGVFAAHYDEGNNAVILDLPRQPCGDVRYKALTYWVSLPKIK